LMARGTCRPESQPIAIRVILQIGWQGGLVLHMVAHVMMTQVRVDFEAGSVEKCLWLLCQWSEKNSGAKIGVYQNGIENSTEFRIFDRFKRILKVSSSLRNWSNPLKESSIQSELLNICKFDRSLRSPSQIDATNAIPINWEIETLCHFVTASPTRQSTALKYQSFSLCQCKIAFLNLESWRAKPLYKGDRLLHDSRIRNRSPTIQSWSPQQGEWPKEKRTREALSCQRYKDRKQTV
jgi:hypothetical protein